MHNESKLSLSLKKTEQTIMAEVDVLLESTKDWQIILKYVTNRANKIVLSAKQQQRLDRYQFIYNQLVSGKFTDTEVVNLVKIKYEVEVWQAYDDIRSTKELFNSTINVLKQFEIKIQLEANKAMLRKAASVNNFDAYAKLEKNRIALLALIEDKEEIPGESFQGHHFTPVFDPTLLGAPEVDLMELLKSINAKRSKKIKTDLFNDIQHEDITNEPADPL